jgi:hypothetical protein
MPIAETAKLMSQLDMNTSGFDRGIAHAQKQLGFFGHSLSTALGIGIQKVASAGISALGNAIGGGIESLAELEDATTAVDSAIAAVGKTGQVTSQQVAGWANDIESSVHAAFDDKAITKAAATLLRFGNVTVDNLHPALVVMTDLAAKTGDIDSAANLLARSLADPTKAAGKLAKQGIILTKAEQDQIKAFVKAGKIGQAQAVILDILAKKTKGAADASQGPFRKAMSTFHDVIEDVQRALAIGFLPVLTKIADFLRTKLAQPQTLITLQKFGTAVAKLFDKGLAFAQKIPWDSIGAALGIAASAAERILDAFLKMPKWVQTAIITGAIAKIALNNIPGGGGGGEGGGGGGIVDKAVEGVAGGLAHAVGSEILSLLGASSFAAAVGAGLATAAPLLAVALAPAILAGGVIALNNITDPKHIRELQGRADIARARGIPDWNNKALQELQAITGNTSNIGGDIETMRNQIAASIDGLPAKSAAVATGILKNGAQRDAELTAAIQALIPTGKQQDDAAFAATVAGLVAGMVPPKFVATVKLDPSQITDIRDTTGAIYALDQAQKARDADTSAGINALVATTDGGLGTLDTSVVQQGANTTNAARMAGVAASSAAYGAGAGIEGAIRANRPIINVDVQISATDITQVNVVEDRGGSRSGSRDGDGGGGPGQ